MSRTRQPANSLFRRFVVTISLILSGETCAFGQNAELDRQALGRKLAADYLVLDWRDLAKVPENYAHPFILTREEDGREVAKPMRVGKGKKGIVVLAGDLEIRSLNWDVERRPVFICADTLRITGSASFQTGHPENPEGPSATEATREARSGGDVTILARHLIFSERGRLTAITRGAAGYYTKRERKDKSPLAPPELEWTEVDDLPCGNGGNVTVIAERLDVPWKENVNLGELGHYEGAVAWPRTEQDWRRAAPWLQLFNGPKPYGETRGVLYVDCGAGESLLAKKLKRSTYRDAELALADLDSRVNAGLGALLVEGKSYNLKDPKQVEKARAVLNKKIEEQKAEAGRYKGLYDTDHRGRRGVVTIVFPEEGALKTLPSSVLNRWALLRADALKLRVEVAEGLRKERAAIARLFYDYRYLPAFPVKGDGSLAFQGRIESLNRRRKELVPPVWHETLTIRQEGLLPQDLHLFTDGETLRPMFAPTSSLLRPNRIDGRLAFGVMTFDPANVERPTLHFDVLLTVDPWIAALAERTLLARGIALPGAKPPSLFTKWRLVPSARQLPGVERLEVTSLGPVLHCALTLAPGKGGLALQQLASANGLPLRFDWSCTQDPSVKGEDFSIPVSFARQTGLDVSLERGKVLNKTGWPVTLEYYRLGEAYYPFVGGPQTIPVGALTKLNIPSQADLAKIQLPATAYALKLTWENLAREFAGSPTEIVEHVTITNELPPRDNRRGGELDTVEVTVTYSRGEGRNAVKQTAGPYPLARKGALGSSVTIPFVKRGEGKRTIVVTGVANYGEGQLGQQSVQSKPVEELTVRITEEMLPPLNK